MTKEELIEGYLVYTDNGIERVHWCNVNGVKELVSPKGKVYGYVPDYFEVKRLQEKMSQAETIFKIIKRNMENPNWHKDRQLTELEIAIKSQVCGYIGRYGVK